MLSDLYNETFTIINQIPKSADTAAKAAWKKHTLKKCGRQTGIYDRTNGMMAYKANTFTAYIYDWESYKPANWSDGGYYASDDKDSYFTVNIGDLIVFADIPDLVPTTLQEFQSLVTKYKDNGGTVSSVQAYLKYKSDGTPWKTNHIEAIKG